jgi:hypothetical protein
LGNEESCGEDLRSEIDLENSKTIVITGLFTKVPDILISCSLCKVNNVVDCRRPSQKRITALRKKWNVPSAIITSST